MKNDLNNGSKDELIHYRLQRAKETLEEAENYSLSGRRG